ncbi:hypothetical protein AB3N61_00275 [Leptospira sp. WS58.C1]|uniref:hypothetical protein n=1 Tax=Leptospira TaxID=171 RepID=UPI0002BF71A6|nr:MULTISPECIES: hypothetical protein [unclassified Leptospira]EMJ99741.1 hypothetical protein LEP1GSC192_0660 [Leptospira sp. B5-022]MCR1792095.1 hypothetical protein [Leptospira sp. id769339]
MKSKVRTFFLVCFSTILLYSFSDCGILVNHEDLCSDDLKSYDDCFTILLIADPACGQGTGTCLPAYVQLAKTLCASRMKLEGCRAHRN